MWYNMLWLFVLSGVINGDLSIFDSSDDSNGSNSSESTSSELDDLFSYLLGDDSGTNEGVKCGPKSKCPTHKCQLDPAVIHGYCCGCSDPSDESPYLCPLDMQCPINTDILCHQFRYTVTCCCQKE